MKPAEVDSQASRPARSDRPARPSPAWPARRPGQAAGTRPGRPAAALAGRRAAGRRPGAPGARPARLPPRAVLHRHDAGTCTTREGMDPVGYKGPLRAILLVANFNAVAAVQHLLGLAMAVVIYLLLLRRGAPRWLAALAIAPVLLDAYQLQIEQTVMPGTWFEALIVAGLAILLWRPETGWRARRRGRRRAGHLGHLRPGGRGPDPARGDLPARRPAAAGGRPSARRPPCARPSPCRSWPTAPAPTCSPATSSCRTRASPRFYGRMAAAADCATIRLPAAERGMCPTKAQQAQGPDWLEYGHGSPIRPYYARPAARRDRQPDLRLQPPGADPAAAAGARRLRARRG